MHLKEHDILSTHSLLSLTTLFLKNNKYYKKADLVHYHQIHNSRFSLPTLFKMFKTKPTIISLHDPWMLTGRCVHPLECNKWETGCDCCNHLGTLFDLPQDNCNQLWKIKSEIANTDIDLLVHSKFMYDMVKKNPYTKNLRVHLVPFGVDIKKFNIKKSKEEIRTEMGIQPNDFVIFLRALKELKGTNYAVEALKKLDNKGNITIITCSNKGLLKEIENKYNIIELGEIEENKVIECYKASDLFLMPSIAESFGMMAVEAMASGVTTLVFDNTALPSTTGAPNYGVLVKNKDSEDLKNKIEYYIEHPKERLKRGEESKKFVTEKYNIDNYYNEISKIYKDVYDKQKYKLEVKGSKPEKIDYSKEKTLLKKLSYIYDELFENFKPEFLNIKYKENEGKTLLTTKNQINIIEKFNESVYYNIINRKVIERKNRNIMNKKAENNNLPKVSIIIPVYNGENYVSLAIDSALRQTYPNIEIIVVNDGSTDRTSKVCKKYGNLIKYIEKTNGGVSTALNEGIKQMTGDYFSWLSHDDLYYPNKVEAEINYLVKNKLIGTKSIIYSNYDIIDEKGIRISTVIHDSKYLNENSARSLLRVAINGLSLLIPKKAFEEVGYFDTSLRCVQDYQLWLEMIKANYKFIHIEDVLVVTRIHSKQVSNTSPKVKTEGNAFWVDAIKHFEKEKNVMGTKYNYYYLLKNLFTGGPYDQAVDYCTKKCMEIEKSQSKKIKDLKVGIIIPYEEITIERRIDSALNQTHENIMIYIIDKKMSDKLSNKYSKNSKIRVLKSSKYKCIREVIDDIIKNEDVDYIAFMNYDSIFDSHKIEEQVKTMYLTESKVSHTSFMLNESNTSTSIPTGYINGYCRKELLTNLFINISTFMIERNYYSKTTIFNNKIFDNSIELLYLYFATDEILLGLYENFSTTAIEKRNYKNKIEKLLSFVIENVENNEKEISLLMEQYKGYLYNDFEMSKREEELNRYKYLLSKEFKMLNKIRKTKNKVLFKKEKLLYNMPTEHLKAGKLDKIVNSVKKYIKK